MPSYFYKAARKDGSLVEGNLEAASEALAIRDIRNQGLLFLHVEIQGDGSGSVSTIQNVKSLSRNQVLSFTSELAVLLKAGLPIDRALRVLIDMSSGQEVLVVMQDLLATVKSGKALSQALLAHNDLFDDFYVSMARSGEASGDLAGILERLAGQLEKAKEVRSSVVSALIYPAILAVVAVISIFVMLGFVVPQFESLFVDMGQALPLLTQIVINAGDAVRDWGLLITFIGFVAFIFIKKWMMTAEGKRWLDQRMLALPMLGAVVFKYQISRFSRTLGTLLGCGVSLLKALDIAVETVTNSEVKEVFAKLIPEVKHGGRMSKVFMEAGLFSPMLIQMIRVGEESGQLDQMLLELARIYDNEVSAGVKRSLTLLEPILILGMGVVIGVIIVAILLGILSVNDLAG